MTQIQYRNRGEPSSTSIPTHLRNNYTDFRSLPISSSAFTSLYEATSKLDSKQYSIRLFDSTLHKQPKPHIDHINHALTVFWRECLYICSRLPEAHQSIRVEDCTLESSIDGRILASFVMPVSSTLAHVCMHTFLQSIRDCIVHSKAPAVRHAARPSTSTESI